jgi:hypothetical protein
MDYIKILLLLYLVLRIINFLPSYNLTLTNYIQNVILSLLLVLLAAHDPIVCMLLLVAILINTKNDYTEQLFTNIKKEDIDKLTQTLTNNKTVPNKTVPNKTVPNKTVPNKTVPNKTVSKIIENQLEECVPEFIISKKMLLNAQNNIVDENNIKKFPNEIEETGVNIQGFYDDISGFNL